MGCTVWVALYIFIIRAIHYRKVFHHEWHEGTNDTNFVKANRKVAPHLTVETLFFPIPLALLPQGRGWRRGP
jgi:hypothetical protein